MRKKRRTRTTRHRRRTPCQIKLKKCKRELKTCTRYESTGPFMRRPKNHGYAY